MTSSELPAYAQALRRHDPDRFLAALFAPPEMRETLLLLTAFNHELARAREVASEPMLALIRLQWWREVIEGAPRRHEVATPLAEALAQGRLDAADLLAMVDGREVETQESIATLPEWEVYVAATAGAFALAAGRVLGADEATRARLRSLGIAYGIAGQIRSVGVLACQGRCLLPDDLLAKHDLDGPSVIANPAGPRLTFVLEALAQRGRDHLAQGRGAYPRGIVAAALPGVLARRDLARPIGPAVPRGLGDRLAVTLAAVRARV